MPKVTIDLLAQMIATGFEHMDNKFERAEKQIATLHAEMNQRFDKLEFKVDRDHLNRIEKLEDAVRVLKTKVGIA